jgi:hypothetical protein
MNILYMNANFPIFCMPLPVGEFSILAPYFSLQTVQFTALSGNLDKQYIGLGLDAFFPWIRDGKKTWSGMNISDSESYLSYLQKLRKKLWVKILKFFDVDSDPGSYRPWIRDGKFRIQDQE